MSLIISFKTVDGIFAFSDSMGLISDGSDFVKYSKARKFFQVSDLLLGFGYCGVESIGKKAYLEFLAMIEQEESFKCITRFSSFFAGLNHGYSLTENAKLLSANGQSPLTGVSIVGYLDGVEILMRITPSGEMISESIVTLGYSSETIKKKVIIDNLYHANIEEVIATCSKYFHVASSDGFSDTNLTIVLISRDKYQKII